MKKKDMSELAQIKVDLRNRTSMYENQKKRVEELSCEIKRLKAGEKEKDELLQIQKETIIRQGLTIEEYKRMLFHKKPKKTEGVGDQDMVSIQEENSIGSVTDDSSTNVGSTEDSPTGDSPTEDSPTEDPLSSPRSIFNQPSKEKRLKESYQKKIPRPVPGSQTVEFPIRNCPECGETLDNIQKYARFIEDMSDIPSIRDSAREVTREIIHSGYCPKCKKQRSPKYISKAVVTYGENLRMFVNFQICIMKQSYENVIFFLSLFFGIEVSSGEIAGILEREAKILTPEYHQIQERIIAQKGVHFDETGWITQREDDGGYAWGMTGTETREVIFSLGQSRGGGVIQKLIGEKMAGEELVKFVGISDNYGAYTNAFDLHQLCWAHPHRKFRDLSESKTLEKTSLDRCKATYEQFGKLYERVRDEIKKEENYPTDYEQRNKLKDELMEQFGEIVIVHENDPAKLITYKTTLLKYKEKYFVCILVPGIPADNNGAERALRHLVLKRKMCNGSITKRSATFMSINYSVLLSLYWQYPTNIFSRYKKIRQYYYENIVKAEEKEEKDTDVPRETKTEATA